MTNPLLTETPIVQINGEDKQLPRLSLSATFAIIGLLKEVVTPETISTVSSLQNEGVSDFDKGVSVVSTLFEVLEDAEERIYKVLSKILQVESKEVEGLALEEIVEIAIAFKDHPDVGFFTKKLPTMLKKQVASPAMTN